MTDEELLTRDEAAVFLRLDRGTVSEWIRSGRLPASRKNPSKKRSPFQIFKSDCIAAVRNSINNEAVNAVGVQEIKACQSNKEAVRGTATSLRLVEKELGSLLGHRIKGKR